MTSVGKEKGTGCNYDLWYRNYILPFFLAASSYDAAGDATGETTGLSISSGLLAHAATTTYVFDALEGQEKGTG